LLCNESLILWSVPILDMMSGVREVGVELTVLTGADVRIRYRYINSKRSDQPVIVIRSNARVTVFWELPSTQRDTNIGSSDLTRASVQTLG
jgi:hypothetical protein